MPNSTKEAMNVNGNGTMAHDEGYGPGAGVVNFFKRLWYHLLVLFIGGKWSLIETFTRHKKLGDDGELRFKILHNLDHAYYVYFWAKAFSTLRKIKPS